MIFLANQNTKERLIEATKSLLANQENYKPITAREISKEAGTNLAMINYCFQSKDELVKIAVDQIIAEEFYGNQEENKGECSKIRLIKLIHGVAKAMIKYEGLMKATIPYSLLEEEIKLPFDILPYVREHYQDRKKDFECRIIAFELVYAMQHIFYRSEDFSKYCGMDFKREEDLKRFIEFQLDLFLV